MLPERVMLCMEPVMAAEDEAIANPVPPARALVLIDIALPVAVASSI